MALRSAQSIRAAGERYTAVEDPAHQFTIFRGDPPGVRLGTIVEVPQHGNTRTYFLTEYRPDHIPTWTEAVLTLDRDYSHLDAQTRPPTAAPQIAIWRMPPPADPASLPPHESAPVGAQAAPPPAPAPAPALDAAAAPAPAEAPLAPDPPAGEWLPTEKAAARLGISRGEMNKRIRRHEVPVDERKSVRNTKAYYVWVPAAGQATTAAPGAGAGLRRRAKYQSAADTRRNLLAALDAAGAAGLGFGSAHAAGGASKDSTSTVLAALIAEGRVRSEGSTFDNRRRYVLIAPAPARDETPPAAVAPAPPARRRGGGRTPILPLAEARREILAALDHGPQSYSALVRVDPIRAQKMRRQALLDLVAEGRVVTHGKPHTTTRTYALVPLAFSLEPGTTAAAPSPPDTPRVPAPLAQRNTIVARARADSAQSLAYTPPDPAPQPTLHEVWQRTWALESRLTADLAAQRDDHDALLIAVKDALRPWLAGLTDLRTRVVAIANDAQLARARTQGMEVLHATLNEVRDAVQLEANKTDSARAAEDAFVYDVIARLSAIQRNTTPEPGADRLLSAVAKTVAETHGSIRALADQLARVERQGADTKARAYESSDRTQAILDHQPTVGADLRGLAEQVQALAEVVRAQSTQLAEIRDRLDSPAPAAGWSLFGRRNGT